MMKIAVSIFALFVATAFSAAHAEDKGKPPAKPRGRPSVTKDKPSDEKVKLEKELKEAGDKVASLLRAMKEKFPGDYTLKECEEQDAPRWYEFKAWLDYRRSLEAFRDGKVSSPLAKPTGNEPTANTSSTGAPPAQEGGRAIQSVESK